MTEHNDVETVTAETFDLMDWIESGTVARRQIEIHNNPALLEEYEALEAELAAAERGVKDAGEDAPMDADDPRQDVVARMEDLYERWQASKATWTVRALSQDEVDATFDESQGGVPVPKQPVPPLEKAGEKAREKYVERHVAWSKANTEANRERRLHIIAAAVVAIETAQGRLERPPGGAPIVTPEQLRALRDRPHGEQWIGKLHKGVTDATEGDVEVPRPTSREGSTSTRASSSR